MDNKVAMVVGGGSGMGAAAARKLAHDGFQVAVMSSSGKGEALGRELGGIGMTGSNQSPDDLQKLTDQVMARWGRIDVLVNSAGHGPKGPVLELTDAQWHLGLDMYFLNVVRAVRVVAPIMVQQKAGSIVNISTAWVGEPAAMFPTSAVARAGLAAIERKGGTGPLELDLRLDQRAPIIDQRDDVVGQRAPIGRDVIRRRRVVDGCVKLRIV